MPALRLAAALLVWAAAPATLLAAADPDPATLQGKVLLGYQGWFNCPGDGSPRNWSSWARGPLSPASLTIDLYPDLTDFAPEDLCAAPGFTIAGRPAYVFTAFNPRVVNRHFAWMKEYGLDGVLVQRFVSDMARKRAGGDVVLKNVIAAARQHGRVFAIEYDISGANPEKFFEQLQEDWRYLVEELKVTAEPGYQRHNGRPLVSVWGMGLNEDRHPPREAAQARRVVQWFKQDAPERLRAAFMGGTPAYWRTRTRDAQTDPAWDAVYASMDVVQPWTVGRYRDAAGVDRWREEMLAGDLERTKANHQQYMPVIFPGFSWANLKRESKPNAIPRDAGRFFWRQAVNAARAGSGMLKIAMFDEVNEGTAVFKAAPRRSAAPEQGYWLTLDADGYDLPSDWYLRLSGEVTRMIHGQRRPTDALPEEPRRLP